MSLALTPSPCSVFSSTTSLRKHSSHNLGETIMVTSPPPCESRGVSLKWGEILDTRSQRTHVRRNHQNTETMPPRRI
jgi:hypothetical protein